MGGERHWVVAVQVMQALCNLGGPSHGIRVRVEHLRPRHPVGWVTGFPGRGAGVLRAGYAAASDASYVECFHFAAK